jgi:hypothetical protein
MRGMNRSILLAMAAQHAAYAAATTSHMTGDMAEFVISGAQKQTTKQMAVQRTRGGGIIYVASAKWVDRSRYMPHQGRQECARRVRQIGA